jgi:Na+-translocating ferredoxin:NAD+ oxidoreductase RNF subunit RnfB
MSTYLIVASLLLLIIFLMYTRNKRAKNKVVHIIESNCKGCQRCLKICRRKALDVVNRESGRLVILKYPEKCTACRDCIAMCKFNALELVSRNQPE